MGIEGGNWFTQLAGNLIQTGTPVRNQWNYVAVTYNGSTITMYVNGTSIGTVASSANAQNSALTIGQDWNFYTTTGYIADVRISNTVRTISVPTAPYTSDGNTRFLASFTNGGIFDSAMMNNLETVGNAQVSTSVVKYGTGSMAFDGTDDTINGPRIVTPQTDFGSGDFTVESWIYINAFTPWSTQYIANKYAANTNEASWYYYVRSTGFTFVYSTDGTNAAATLTGSTTVSTGTWHHVAITRSGNNFRFFLNGTQIGSTQTLSGTIFQGVITRLSVGSNNGVLNINGYMDDFRITKGAARYIGNFTPPVARMPQQ
jgi:hypothetical protein